MGLLLFFVNVFLHLTSLLANWVPKLQGPPVSVFFVILCHPTWGMSKLSKISLGMRRRKKLKIIEDGWFIVEIERHKNNQTYLFYSYFISFKKTKNYNNLFLLLLCFSSLLISTHLKRLSGLLNVNLFFVYFANV